MDTIDRTVYINSHTMDSRRSSYVSQLDYNVGIRVEVELKPKNKAVTPTTAKFFLPQESRASLEETRQAVAEFVQAVTRVDNALTTLRKELLEMRDQDLQLLKQLIQIGETIRRMSRSREVREPIRTFDTSQETNTSYEDLTSSLPRWNGWGERLLGAEFNSVPLVRRQSEPQMCMMDRLDVCQSDLRRSGSSMDAWSLGTLDSSDDTLDLLASMEDLIDASSTSISFSITNKQDEVTGRLDTISESAPEAAVLRPKSHSVVASTFMTRTNLAGGHSAYSDILNRNVRLWKCRNSHAQDGRPREPVLEEEV